jgi:Tfp pilus assembly protein PilO
MAALTKAAKKERNARILGALILGAMTVSATSYIIAPRFQEPIVLLDEANSSLGAKIVINERISLLNAQSSRQGLAKAELLEMQNRFPSATEMASLEQAINEAILAAGLTPSSLTQLVFETEFIGAADANLVSDPKAPSSPSGEDAKIYAKKFSITVVGAPANLASLVANLTNLNRVIVLDRISINNDPQLGLNILSIEARTFIMPNALENETEAVDLEEVNSIFDNADDEGSTE